METSKSSEMYSSLRRAQLTYAYLHTNSTTHEFLFGALAELVDNARDASSKRIDIYTVPAQSFRGKFMLCFRDDGDGMDPGEVANVIQFGRSVKRKVDQNMIGQYGNGLKSGTMRIGKDMILLSKKNNLLSCLFLSRTFHEKEDLDEVVVPMPSWEGKTKKPHTKNEKQHHFEVNLILKYSPFKTEKELFAEFDKLGTTGTLVVVYNLALMDNGEPELDVKTDPYDIMMADPHAGETYGDDNDVVPERKSFRAYSAVLYLDPKMKIYVQNKKVHTKRIITCLYKPKSYQFTSTRFKRRSEKEAEDAEQEYKLADEKARELEMQDREIREKAEKTSKDTVVEQRKASQAASEARTEANMKYKTAETKKKALKDPKTLNFNFGINLERRKCYGIMVYNCSRLIKMYEKVGCQIEGGMKGYGILGVVDVPYLVLEPTHNKQDFADNKEFRSLTRALGEHLDHYWKDCPIATQGVTKFWESYGYVSTKWKDDPSKEPKYLRKRTMDLPIYVQCDKCLKWRELAFHSSYVGKDLPDDWSCISNPNSECNKCHRPEKKVNIPKATLKKLVKTAEEKKKLLEEDVRKKREMIEQIDRGSGIQASLSRPVVEDIARRQPKPVVPPTRNSQVKQVSQAKPAVRSPPVRSPPTPTQTAERSRTSTTPKSSQVGKNNNNLSVGNAENEQKTPQKLKRPHSSVTIKQEAQKTVKRKKEDIPPAIEVPQPSKSEVQPSTVEMEWGSDGEVATPSQPTTQQPPNITTLQGRLCEGRTDNNEWHIAKIVTIKQKEDITKVKVKYRDHPKDKFDKWYVYPGPDIHLLEPRESEKAPSRTLQDTPPQTEVPSITSPPSLPPSPSIELPSTTTTIEPVVVRQALPGHLSPQASPEQSSPVRSPDNNVSSVADREEMLQEIASVLRDCLAFFVPPDYSPPREELQHLPLERLRSFPVSNFCNEYEKGLSKLINDFVSGQNEAERKLTEMENKQRETAEKLSSLRRSAMRLIGSVNENLDLHELEANHDTDQVDAMLEAIANSANP